MPPVHPRIRERQQHVLTSLRVQLAAELLTALTMAKEALADARSLDRQSDLDLPGELMAVVRASLRQLESFDLDTTLDAERCLQAAEQLSVIGLFLGRLADNYATLLPAKDEL